MHVTKKHRVAAMWGAILVSTLISIEIEAVLFGMAYFVLEGVVTYIAYVAATAITLSFSIWFYRRAYRVELELSAGQEKNIDSS
ncbi:MAG: hypothetical protein R3229_15420 [Alphaproteobacteria bacterium]|nr:hypothetical protein [Alphaproteobacteria bacterium]